ncbi:MAG: hypothetical protein ABSC93_02375 [Bryobacteraceae bacterium]|jgi:hypothetical protein
MDMADWKGVPLRRWLRSADRSRALLPLVTRYDQRDGEAEDACAIPFEEQFRYRPMANELLRHRV